MLIALGLLVGASAICRWFFKVHLPNEYERVAQTEHERTLRMIKEYYQNPEQIVKTEIKIVAKTLDDVVGRYQGQDIVRLIKTNDGRIFEYESVADMTAPVTAYDPNFGYVVLHGLLYKEVKGIAAE